MIRRILAYGSYYSDFMQTLSEDAQMKILSNTSEMVYMNFV